VLQVETNDDSVRKHITDDDVAALVISESTIGAERKLEEEGIPTHVSPSCILHCWHETKSC